MSAHILIKTALEQMEARIAEGWQRLEYEKEDGELCEARLALLENEVDAFAEYRQSEGMDAMAVAYIRDFAKYLRRLLLLIDPFGDMTAEARARVKSLVERIDNVDQGLVCTPEYCSVEYAAYTLRPEFETARTLQFKQISKGIDLPSKRISGF